MSLLDGRLPIPLAMLALILVWSGRGRLSLPKLLWILVGVGATVVVAGHAVGVENRVGSSFPRSFYLWSSLPVFALVVWAAPRRRPRARRWTALAGAVVFCAFGALEVNAHYGYRPTVHDLLGLPLPDLPTRLTGHTSLATRSASPVVRAAASPASDGHGQLDSVALPGVVSHFDARSGYVWLPPKWFVQPRPALPVVLMLGGVPSEPADLIRGSAAVNLADRYARAHRGLAPIVVFADENGSYLNDSECVDGPRGQAETYLTRDVPSAIIARYGASPDPKDWAVVGYSEGGTCAVSLTLRHPDVFGSFVGISGDTRPNASRGSNSRARTITELYGGRAGGWAEHDLPKLAATAHPGRSWLVAGDQDTRARASQQALAANFGRGGAGVTALTVAGGHTFPMVRLALEATFPPLADQLLKVGSPRSTAHARAEM